ncbi:helix-turn-helix domain-containing protein [Streptosporangium sandarakinum]
MPGRPQMVLRDPAELNRLIERQFKTTVALATISGVNRQTIGWLRTGHRCTTSRRSADALAEALGVTTDRLFRPWSSDDASPHEEESMLLTIPQVKEALQCGETHVYRLIAAGALDATDIAAPGSRKSKTRVPRTSLQDYVRRQTRQTRQPATVTS